MLPSSMRGASVIGKEVRTVPMQSHNKRPFLRQMRSKTWRNIIECFKKFMANNLHSSNCDIIHIYGLEKREGE